MAEDPLQESIADVKDRSKPIGSGAKLTVGVPAEVQDGERRVALAPDGVKSLVDAGLQIVIQSRAGEGAHFSDEAYQAAGATIAPASKEVFEKADLILKVLGPTDGRPGSDLDLIRPGTACISFLFPVANPGIVQTFANKNITSFAMELMPRISRAQSMDALSSMSTIAGYKAVLLAAAELQKFFPMLMTAAGTLPPAKVFVIGAGVAGLQAIATSKRLGAMVEAFDVRPAVKEQIESLGGKFVGMQLLTEESEDSSGYAKEVSGDTHVRELELIASRLPKVDVVITTALIPGRTAPILITSEMLKSMKPGSVIVDLAAPAGGNCEGTVPGQTVVVDGVTIIGRTDLLSITAADASRMYSKNITTFLTYMVKEGQLSFDMDDEIIKGTLVTHDGKVVHEPTRLALERSAPV